MTSNIVSFLLSEAEILSRKQIEFDLFLITDTSYEGTVGGWNSFLPSRQIKKYLHTEVDLLSSEMHSKSMKVLYGFNNKHETKHYKHKTCLFAEYVLKSFQKLF